MATVDIEQLGKAQEDALALAAAAIQIDQARTEGGSSLTTALDHNLQLWVGIKTLMQRPDNPMPKPIRDNLIQLSQFVTQKTFEVSNGVTDEILDSLIAVNLQISEGLLESKPA